MKNIDFKNDKFITRREMMFVLDYKPDAYLRWKKEGHFPIWKLNRDAEVALRSDFENWVLSKRLG